METFLIILGLYIGWFIRSAIGFWLGLMAVTFFIMSQDVVTGHYIWFIFGIISTILMMGVNIYLIWFDNPAEVDHTEENEEN